MKLNRETVKLFKGLEKIIQSRLMIKFWKDKDINMVLHLEKKVVDFIIAEPKNAAKEKQLWEDILEDMKKKVENWIEKTLYDDEGSNMGRNFDVERFSSSNNISERYKSVVETIDQLNKKIHCIYIHCEEEGKFNEFKKYKVKIFTNGDSLNSLEWNKWFQPFEVEKRDVDLEKELESENIPIFIDFLRKYWETDRWKRDEFSNTVSHIFYYAKIVHCKFKSKIRISVLEKNGKNILRLYFAPNCSKLFFKKNSENNFLHLIEAFDK